jgi:hypothetical protein
LLYIVTALSDSSDHDCYLLLLCDVTPFSLVEN